MMSGEVKFLMNKLEIEFVGRKDNTGSVKIELHSKFTCIYGKDSGEGKTKFIEIIREGIIQEDIEVLTPQGYTFQIIDEINLNLVIDSKNMIVMIDEMDMVRNMGLINKSRCIFIAVSRALPFHGDYSIRGLYKTVWYGDSVDILPLEALPCLEKFYDVDLILVEGKIEYQVLSFYFKNVVSANSRDKIANILTKYKDKSIIVFADLGNIGRSYKLLMKKCKDNNKIKFYPYDCIEQLFCDSEFIKRNGRGHTIEVFDTLTKERYYEIRLYQETKGTDFEYNHKKKLNKVYIPSDYEAYLEDFLKSETGRILYEYLKNR